MLFLLENCCNCSLVLVWFIWVSFNDAVENLFCVVTVLLLFCLTTRFVLSFWSYNADYSNYCNTILIL